MPSKCTKCGKVHEDDSRYLLDGCDQCGSRFFFFIREGSTEEFETEMENLTPKEVDEIERDVRDIIPENLSEDETVVLDLEAIRVIKPGKYRIDVTTLFSQNPIVIRVGPGKYELDLSNLIKRIKNKHDKN